MLNWINRHDFERVWKRWRSGELQELLLQTFQPGRDRVRSRWQHTHQPPVYWWDIPEIPRRWNELISGDPSVEAYEYLCQTFLTDRADLRGLSPGCGIGNKELLWAKTGHFSRLDACDLSPERIEYANGVARQDGVEHILQYFVGDVYHLSPPPGHYDVVLFEQALHHFSPLEPLLARIRHWIHPEGWLFLNEFVGADRFQWGKQQLQAAQEMLDSLPEHLRQCWDGSGTKTRVFRPSLLQMYLSDPSESVESSAILELLPRYFEIVECKGYGGSLLPLVFSDIAHHFVHGTDEAMEHLFRCFAWEDEWLLQGNRHDDFVIVACRPLRSSSCLPVGDAG